MVDILLRRRDRRFSPHGLAPAATQVYDRHPVDELGVEQASRRRQGR